MQLGELHKRRLDSENPAKKASRLFEMPVGLGPGTTCFVGNNWTKPTARNSHDPSSHLPARERFGDHVRALRSTNGQRVRLRCANEPCQPRAESGDLMPVFSVEGKSSLIAVRCRLRAKFPDRFTRALSSVSVCVCHPKGPDARSAIYPSRTALRPLETRLRCITWPSAPAQKGRCRR